MEERLVRRGGDEVCLPEVINLHQKSNNVKMSFQHLQLSEPVFRLFLSNAQHGAFLQTPERKHETSTRCCRGTQAAARDVYPNSALFHFNIKTSLSFFFFNYLVFIFG